MFTLASPTVLFLVTGREGDFCVEGSSGLGERPRLGRSGSELVKESAIMTEDLMDEVTAGYTVGPNI